MTFRTRMESVYVQHPGKLLQQQRQWIKWQQQESRGSTQTSLRRSKREPQRLTSMHVRIKQWKEEEDERQALRSWVDLRSLTLRQRAGFGSLVRVRSA